MIRNMAFFGLIISPIVALATLFMYLINKNEDGSAFGFFGYFMVKIYKKIGGLLK